MEVPNRNRTYNMSLKQIRQSLNWKNEPNWLFCLDQDWVEMQLDANANAKDDLIIDLVNGHPVGWISNFVIGVIMHYFWVNKFNEELVYNSLYPQGLDNLFPFLSDNNADAFVKLPFVGFLLIDNVHWISYIMEYDALDENSESTIVISIADSSRTGVSEGEEKLNFLLWKDIPSFFHQLVHKVPAIRSKYFVVQYVKCFLQVDGYSCGMLRF